MNNIVYYDSRDILLSNDLLNEIKENYCNITLLLDYFNAKYIKDEKNRLLIESTFTDSVLFEKSVLIKDIEQIKHIFESNYSIETIINKIVGRRPSGKISFNYCKWNEHHYIKDIYDLLCYLSDECLLSDKLIYKMFGLKIENTINESYNIFKDIKISLLNTAQNNNELYIKYVGAKNIDELFSLLSQQYTTIHKAVYELFDIIYPNVVVYLMKETKIGLNNYNIEFFGYDHKCHILTGFKCWILKKRGYIKSDDTFKNACNKKN